MKKKLVIVCSLALLLVAGLVACAPASSGTPATGNIKLSCDDFSGNNNITRQVYVNAGSTFKVTLCSNATTGYKWSENAAIGNPAVVKQVSQKFIEPGSTMAGAPGEQEWEFSALKAGTTTISMDYSRDWEGGEKGTWTFKADVTVK
jgi:inhibitor of cysteine peptidase